VPLAVDEQFEITVHDVLAGLTRRYFLANGLAGFAGPA
jgi:hypothetical protein